jgi:hypothetical protein
MFVVTSAFSREYDLIDVMYYGEEYDGDGDNDST